MQAENSAYMKKVKKEAIGEIIRFCIAGVLVTATAGYIAGFIVNYYLSAYFIFREKTSAKNGAGFGIAHVVNYLLQMVLLNFFLWTGLTAEQAPIGVYAVSTPVNFLLVRFVFKRFKGNH